MIELRITSKHMIAHVEKESARIVTAITTGIFKAYASMGMRVTVSHDPENETEKTMQSAKALCDYVLGDAPFDDGDGYCDGTFYVFAYYKGNKEPQAWVRCQAHNVQDLIVDYQANALNADALQGVLHLASTFD